jgi:hypothetical protein
MLARMTPSSHRASAQTRGATFARQARAALEKYLPESRTGGARWGSSANLAWVRWRREDGVHVYAALRRHLDWVTGETGLSREPRELSDLPVLAALPAADAFAFRIRLGDVLHEEDRWWPAGAGERELVERLEWLALQLAVKGGALLRRWPGTPA